MTYERRMNFAFTITICENTCNLVHAFMCKHFLLQAMFPKLVQLVQISICYTCQLFDLYYLYVSALQLFCILFPICVIYILSNNFLYISCELMHTYQQDILSCNRFPVILTCFMMYWYAYAHFDFLSGLFLISYSLHTIYNNMKLII